MEGFSGGLTSPVTTQFESRYESHCMVSFKVRQNISIVSFCEEKMNLIESGIQLASINLAWNLSSAILGRRERQLLPHYPQSDWRICNWLWSLWQEVAAHHHPNITVTWDGQFLQHQIKGLIIWYVNWSKHKSTLEYITLNITTWAQRFAYNHVLSAQCRLMAFPRTTVTNNVAFFPQCLLTCSINYMMF